MKRSVLGSLILVVLWGCFAVAAAQDADTLTTDDIAKLRAAAEEGNATAQYQLGDAYQKGEGIHQDDSQAAIWFQKAADQNNPDAMFALGFAYRGGFGVAKDPVISYMWFDLAAKQGHEQAMDMRSEVAELMTYEQISDARKRSRQWQPVVPERAPPATSTLSH